MKDDIQLVELIRAGDREAFREMVESYQKRVYSHCFNFTKNKEDALDLSQEVFVRVYRHIDGFKGESSLSTWIYRITSNLCINWHRKNSRVVSVPLAGEDEEKQAPEDLLPDETFSPDRQFEKTELKDAVREGIGKLSAEHKEIVIMRDVNGMTYDEIGQVLDLEAGTVKSRLSRAREQLRKYLISKHRNLFDTYLSNKS